MFALLLALQISSTDCTPTATGGQHCMTMGGGQTQYVDPDWGAAFKARRDRKIRQAVGKLLANGDCAGAEKYALEKGELELAGQVKDYCAR